MKDRFNENFVVDSEYRDFDWSDYPDFDWVTQTNDGTIVFYESKPKIVDIDFMDFQCWSNQSMNITARNYSGYIGEIDSNPNWKEAIQEKPKRIKTNLDKIFQE